MVFNEIKDNIIDKNFYSNDNYENLKNEFIKKNNMYKLLLHVSIFCEENDIRIQRTKKYTLAEILFSALIAILCGAKSYYEIVHISNLKINYLRKFFPFVNGIPSHDTYNRIFKIIDSTKIEKLYRSIISIFVGNKEIKHIAIDGKCIKGSKDENGKPQVTMVSAWACDEMISIAQEKVKEKSNEITAVPKLIDVLYLRNTVVTMDAMGAQANHVQMIIAKGGHYIICLKGNQSSTYEDIKLAFERSTPDNTYNNIDKRNGVVIDRTYKTISKMKLIPSSKKWTGLKTVVCVETNTYNQKTGKNNTDIRYFISSIKNDAQFHAKIIREHWYIENHLHRTLDVDFSEDNDTKRSGNSAQNFSAIRKLALIAINSDKRNDISKRLRMMTYLSSDEFLDNAVCRVFNSMN